MKASRNQKLLVAILILVAISATSCQKAWWEQLKKDVQTTDRSYQIEQYSGGKLIATFKFTGTLNSSEGSDGVYFYQGNTLVELSGDLIIRSTKAGK